MKDIRHIKALLPNTIRPTRQLGKPPGKLLAIRVVELLYAATQAIVDKAHKGSGMSQNGAYAYAAQGYDYRQISGVYYPGVAIARLELK